MQEKEDLKKELKEELQWVKYRQKMLAIIEEKLMQMKYLVQYAKEGNLSSPELEKINVELNRLMEQVNALDEESKRIE